MACTGADASCHCAAARPALKPAASLPVWKLSAHGGCAGEEPRECLAPCREVSGWVLLCQLPSCGSSGLQAYAHILAQRLDFGHRVCGSQRVPGSWCGALGGIRGGWFCVCGQQFSRPRVRLLAHLCPGSCPRALLPLGLVARRSCTPLFPEHERAQERGCSWACTEVSAPGGGQLGLRSTLQNAAAVSIETGPPPLLKFQCSQCSLLTGLMGDEKLMPDLHVVSVLAGLLPLPFYRGSH